MVLTCGYKKPTEVDWAIISFIKLPPSSSDACLPPLPVKAIVFIDLYLSNTWFTASFRTWNVFPFV